MHENAYLLPGFEEFRVVVIVRKEADVPQAATSEGVTPFPVYLDVVEASISTKLHHSKLSLSRLLPSVTNLFRRNSTPYLQYEMHGYFQRERVREALDHYMRGTNQTDILEALFRATYRDTPLALPPGIGLKAVIPSAMK
jgi:hypothetical protein